MEKVAFLKRYGRDFLLFPEDRSFPIRMTDEIPLRWTEHEPAKRFQGTAARNEYYVFQIGVYALRKELERINVTFSDLRSDRRDHPRLVPDDLLQHRWHRRSRKNFLKNVTVGKGKVQPLWMGIDIPPDAAPGVYTGTVTIAPANAPPRSVTVGLTIADTLLADRGDGELWRHSRLRWLNSTLGIDSSAVAPYAPISSAGDGRYTLTGHDVRLAADGLPSSITSWGENVLAAPMQFVVETSEGTLRGTDARVLSERNTGGMLLRTALLQKGDLRLEISSTLESDGYSLHTYRLTAERTSGSRTSGWRSRLPAGSPRT